jgi:hypothetical protein
LYVEKPHPTEEQFSEIMWWSDNDVAHMPKRLKIAEKGFCHMELKRMMQEDRESNLRGIAERTPDVVETIVEIEKIVYVEKEAAYQPSTVVEIEKIVYVEKDARPSEPLFKGGQAVHQFWAAWMGGAAERPDGIKGKSRPAWFNSQVFAATALSPSMPRCRNDRDFPRHQLSRSLSFRHLGMLGDRNVPRCCIQRFGRQSATADSRRQSGATESTDGTAKLTKGWPLSGQ